MILVDNEVRMVACNVFQINIHHVTSCSGYVKQLDYFEVICPIGPGGASMPNVFVISAPSGAGKTSLVSALIEQVDGLVCAVSHTTRLPRAGEIDSQAYHFVDEQAFNALVKADAFVEHARVFNDAYGTTQAELARHFEAQCDVLLEIDWQGAQQVRAALPGSVSVFILPPSLQVLEQRLCARRQDSEQVIDQRMAQAQSELSHYYEYEYAVMNDQFEVALQDLISIIRAVRLRSANMESVYQTCLASSEK